MAVTVGIGFDTLGDVDVDGDGITIVAPGQNGAIIQNILDDLRVDDDSDHALVASLPDVLKGRLWAFGIPGKQAYTKAWSPSMLKTPHPIGITQPHSMQGIEHISKTRAFKHYVEDEHAASEGKERPNYPKMWATFDATNGVLPAYHLYHELGMTYPPHVVSKEALDEYIAGGEKELYRGTTSGPEGADQFAKQMQSGAYFAGRGGFGSGYYSGGDAPELSQPGENRALAIASVHASTPFGSGIGEYEKGRVLRMSIKSDAKVAEFSELRAEADKHLGGLQDEMKRIQDDSASQGRLHALRAEYNLCMDYGAYAAMQGYDVMRIKFHECGNVVDEYLILNRTAVRVQEDILDPIDMSDRM